MSLWDNWLSAFTTIFRHARGWNVSASWTLPTGYTNMKNPDLLREAQDKVWESGAFLPKEEDGAETTYCNMAVNAVLAPMGCTILQGMTADQMVTFMRTSKDFLIKPMADCQFLTNLGTVIVAGLTSAQLKQGHGHVATLTPGVEDYSGHWDKKAPVCLSIGRKAICFRSKGVNWAFVPEPEFYAWVPSL